MPSSRARAFICFANPSSEPASPSAMMMQASLAFWIMMPRMRSATGTSDLSAANMVVVRAGAPPVRQACSETGKRRLQRHRPLVERLEHHLQRHQLGHRARHERRVGVLLVENGAIGEVGQDCPRCLGLDRRLSGQHRNRRQQDRQRQDDCSSVGNAGRECPHQHEPAPETSTRGQALGRRSVPGVPEVSDPRKNAGIRAAPSPQIKIRQRPTVWKRPGAEIR